MADFYAARSGTIPPLPWSNFALPLSGLDRVPATADGIRAAGYSDINRLVEDVVNRDTMKPSAWEKCFTAPMRFNRLILFSPWMFHNSAPGFGTGIDDGRLAYLMFFAATA